MYTTTFYSFKGGVGRTLALVNVAVALSRAGRRVLLVDFDLEAPGIHTFDALRPAEAHPGVVEFVTEFKASMISPDASHYIYEVGGVAEGVGRLWVMPAGKGDEKYRAKLAAIDWQALYRNYDGYILFEDLKAQWQRLYRPDYVFIDSRTGHTDIEGICTRQLPDAVVALFVPNEQNLSGLRQVVSDIRAEAQGQRGKKITLHFVMSNVPDLDDEEEILNQRLKEFQQGLGYKELAATIHRYETFALLNQVIFTQARPKSRLAREYLELKDAVVAENIADREGALRFLKDAAQPWGGFAFTQSKDEVDQRLSQIEKTHAQDGELLFLVAMVRKSEGRLEDALALLDEAIERGNRTGAALLGRANIRQELKDTAGAVEDIKAALELQSIEETQAERAVRMLRKLDESALTLVPRSSAVRSLNSEGQLLVAHALMSSRTGLALACQILRPLLQATLTDQLVIVHELVLCLIGLGGFEEAVSLIAARPSTETMPVSWTFNQAMAEWGHTGRPPVEIFQRALTQARDKENAPVLENPNFRQCLAICFWAVGDSAAALQSLEKSENKMKKRRVPEFSCWRYYEIPPQDFLEDCRSIRQLLAGEDIHPRFFSPQGG